ncbi:MAG: sulfite exporter TauE/SafE family protein [Alphaproteobacteria bacterium]|uniref:Sulfite exporter TauE/SafE family protein n=1 Tax=Candidatus Nitrobium versatile TaxID=2884831 RepID=A0A953J9M4_9BACT|nr:sulfite exporter TauE/SafE family protein [Candidatus Nitrobium versatile]
MEASYLLMFTTGLLGGFGHCIGMCGPLVASYTLNAACRGAGSGRAGLLLPHLLYNAGRISSYTFLGALMGLAGSFVNIAGRLAGLQNGVAVVAGALMIIMGLGVAGILRSVSSLERHNSLLLRAVRVVLEGDSVWRYYPLGILLGFLPCGLSYSAFIAAAGTGSLPQGLLLALCFGLGTIPPLLLFGVVINYLSAKVRGWVYRTGGLVIIGLGIYFIYRGFAA